MKPSILRSYATFLVTSLAIAAFCITVQPVCAQLNCAPVPSGLVGWWPGEANGADSLGINNGNLEGNVAFVPGEVGDAFTL